MEKENEQGLTGKRTWTSTRANGSAGAGAGPAQKKSRPRMIAIMI
jgi:hypothetical protein